MKEDISPEEKLLEIIRKGNDVSPKKESPMNKSVLLSFSYFQKIIKSFSLKRWLPGIIISLFVFSLALLLLNVLFAFLPPGINRLKPADNKEIESQLTANEVRPPALETYIEQVRKKDIFNSASFKKENNSEPVVDGLKNFGLLGIISAEPKQAIIKDKTTEEIYYLKEGENLGELKVSRILGGKIVVEYRGERFEIYL